MNSETSGILYRFEQFCLPDLMRSNQNGLGLILMRGAGFFIFLEQFFAASGVKCPYKESDFALTRTEYAPENGCGQPYCVVRVRMPEPGEITLAKDLFSFIPKTSPAYAAA